ncbi:MAG: hypothetical protein RL748_2666 [Pseudomonadota bacterium]|jgi:hypothetical protein
MPAAFNITQHYVEVAPFALARSVAQPLRCAARPSGSRNVCVMSCAPPPLQKRYMARLVRLVCPVEQSALPRAPRFAVSQAYSAYGCAVRVMVVRAKARKKQRQLQPQPLRAASCPPTNQLVRSRAAARQRKAKGNAKSNGNGNSNSTKQCLARFARRQHQHPARPSRHTLRGRTSLRYVAPFPQGVPSSRPPRARGSPQSKTASKATAKARLACGASLPVGLLAPHLPAYFIRSLSRPSPTGAAQP